MKKFLEKFSKIFEDQHGCTVQSGSSYYRDCPGIVEQLNAGFYAGLLWSY